MVGETHIGTALCIQVAKAAWHCTCGSCAIIRTDALMILGGMLA